jgi:hypothetical protein
MQISECRMLNEKIKLYSFNVLPFELCIQN